MLLQSFSAGRETNGSGQAAERELCSECAEEEAKSRRGWQRAGPDSGTPCYREYVEGRTERLKAVDGVTEADMSLPVSGNNTLEDVLTSRV